MIKTLLLENRGQSLTAAELAAEQKKNQSCSRLGRCCILNV